MHAQIQMLKTVIIQPLNPFNQECKTIPLNHISVSNPTQKPMQVSPQINQTQCQLLGKSINSSTYASILESCKCPNLGKQVHAHTMKTGFWVDQFVETKLLQMYGRCGCLEDADLLFDKMPLRNLYSYTAILSLYSEHQLFEKAVWVFKELQFEDIVLEFFVFPLVLKICSGLNVVDLGRQLHGVVIKHQFASNVYVGNALIDMYGKCGSLNDARNVFEMMTQRDCVSWNAIVTACAANGMVFEALELLHRMSSEDDNLRPNVVSWSAVIGGFAQNGYDAEAMEMLFSMQRKGVRPNARTLASVLPACARLEKLKLGKELHGYITRHGFMSNSFVVNGLVDVYRRCGDMESAFKLFSRFSVKNEVSCNTMIVGYCENGNVSEAKKLFDRIEQMGIKKGIITWNSMISGYVDNLMFDEALSLFRDLLIEDDIKPNSFTFGSVLTACADTASIKHGKEVHARGIIEGLQSDTFVGGALVEMYSRCNRLVAAQMAFDEISTRDASTWNGLISGYARNNQIEKIQDLVRKMKEDGLEPDVYTWNGIIAGHVENDRHNKAMQLFYKMQISNLKPDIYTIGIILSACSSLATMERGKQVHAYSIRFGYESDARIGAALVDMYAKCGCLRNAISAYKRISKPDIVSHNAMLTAFAMHGHGDGGITHFRKTVADGIRPDDISFLSVLSACVHSGSVKLGHEFFDLMQDYNVKPSIKHYTCMVDLMSRSGELNEAYKLIMKSSVVPDTIMWGALLGGCVVHGNVELGEIAAEKIIELDPNNTGNYVVLANLYARAGRWSDLAKTRLKMKEKGIHKNPGCSWIEDKDDVHVFLAGDTSHERTKEIYNLLDNLTLNLNTQIEVAL